MTNFLQVCDVTKQFGAKTAVSNLSLSIKKGEIVCLLGPSGCGKTTLLRMIAGLARPDSGTVWCEGEDFTNVPVHERDFGMMFQDFALFPHKDVFGNIAFGLQMRRSHSTQIAARVTEMLDLVDLTGYEKRDVTQLSGGEKQRVALARSLAPDPKLLLLDEPLGALDRALRERLMVELRQILKEVGVTAVTVTHDQTEAFAIADRVVVMNNGVIEQIDTPQKLYAHPRTPFVAQFLGFKNLLAGKLVADGVVETEIGRLRLPTDGQKVGDTVSVLIKPTGLNVVMEGELHGRVTAVSFRGRFTQLWLIIAGQSLLFELENPGDVQIGQTIQLNLSQESLLLL